MPREHLFPHTSVVNQQSTAAELANAGVPENGLPGWSCARAFNWWVVSSSSNGGLPLASARELHVRHGKTLLPLGQPKVADIGDLTDRQGRITSYHVRSQEAFKALVQAINSAKPA